MPAPVLTERQLDEVYLRLLRGERMKDLAREYGVDYANLVRRIKTNYDFQSNGRWAETFKPPTDPYEIGYMAGLFDGEGSIFPTKRFYGWQARISMTNEEVMRWLHSFGGVLNYSILPPPRQPLWLWAISRYRDVPLFCETLLPHLMVKRDKVQECLEYYQTTPLPSYGRNPMVRIKEPRDPRKGGRPIITMEQVQENIRRAHGT